MAEIWIEFHATRLLKLKKFNDLRKTLQMGQYEVLGILGKFWCEVLELREDGDISSWDTDYFATLMALKLSPDRVWKAFENGWIDTNADGRKIVHDWLDYAGKYLIKKYKDTNRERLVKIWAIHGKVYGDGKSYRSDTEAETKQERTPPNQPNQPNQKKEINKERKVFCPPTPQEATAYAKTIDFDLDGQAFVSFYESKGWLIGKSPMRNWQAAVRTWKANPNNKSSLIKPKTFIDVKVECQSCEWQGTVKVSNSDEICLKSCPKCGRKALTKREA